MTSYTRRVITRLAWLVGSIAALLGPCVHAQGYPAKAVRFTVPPGNFGDIFAGYAAARMGLPIERLIIATNVNDILARTLASEVAGFSRGIRMALFSVEEWALTGSAQYVDNLGAEERGRIAVNINLDSVAGSSRLAALSSADKKACTGRSKWKHSISRASPLRPISQAPGRRFSTCMPNNMSSRSGLISTHLQRRGG